LSADLPTNFCGGGPGRKIRGATYVHDALMPLPNPNLLATKSIRRELPQDGEGIVAQRTALLNQGVQEGVKVPIVLGQ
jgi:hypothetical protein